MGDSAKNLPVIEIKPERRWLNFELAELWRSRELIYFLTWREAKIRYKQTAIGVLWAILQPVLTTVIFTVIFSQIARFDSGDIPYPLFALSGLLLWLYFNNAVSNASNALLTNTSLVTKVYLPRMIVPLSVVLAGLIDLLIGLAILAGMLLYYRIQITATILLAPVFILMTVVLAASFGVLFSAVNVRFRDVKYALPFLLQIWMFLSPVFYSQDILSEKWKMVLRFNPLYGILSGFRASLLGGGFDWPALEIAAGLTIFMLLFSMFVFKRLENNFADVI
jgi:lipopolysaccharide transport system permease protein